jgi:uncharacterized protein (TIGR02145 family)
MKFRFLPLLLLPMLGMAQTNSNGEMSNSGNTNSEKQALEIKRNAEYNLEEIKVRWKKAALENCPGVPCVTVTAPGSPTNVTAVAGNALATVSFTAPSSTGGSAITGYTVTSSPVGGTGSGTSSPITVTGLMSGTSYTFTVIATNAGGSSVASAASSAVTPVACGLVTSVTIDGYSYPTVSIGTQCWTKENLRVRRYSDGTEIRFDKSGGSAGTVSQTWSGTRLNYGAYTLYEHDSIATPSSNLTTYGYLYNWYAVKGIITDGGMSTNNICATGWHVPTDSDWNKLVKSIDSGADTSANSSTQSTTAGGKMKSTSTLWNTATPPSPGTDNFGFTVLPGGYRNNDGSFGGIRGYAFFWSATEDGSNYAWSRGLNGASGNVGRPSFNKSLGASVRCLRD